MRAANQHAIHRDINLGEIGRLELDAHAEIGERVAQGPRRRMERLHAGRPLRLQVEPNSVPIGEGRECELIGEGQRGEVAQHQDLVCDAVVGFVADRELDLRQATSQREAADQLAQLRQQRRNVRRQHRAAAHVGDEARLSLVEADQHAPLFRHVTHRQPGALAVTPGRSVNRRQQLARAHPSDMPKRILEHALLGGDLRRRVQMLQAAAAADAKMRAQRRDARRAGAQNLGRAGELVARFPAIDFDRDELADQRAFDKYRLAVDARDAAAFLIERGDEYGIHRLAARGGANQSLYWRARTRHRVDPAR